MPNNSGSKVDPPYSDLRAVPRRSPAMHVDPALHVERLGFLGGQLQSIVAWRTELAESSDRKTPVVFDANSLLQVIRSLEEKTSLLRTFLYLLRAVDVEMDFSQVRTPSGEELSALSEASPDCARLVTAYSELMTDVRRKAAETAEEGDEPGCGEAGPEDSR